MIEDKTKKYLTKYLGKKGKIAFCLIWFMPILMLISSLINIYLSHQWLQRSNYQFADLINVFIKNGFDVNSSYSGHFLNALSRFETAILQIGFAILFFSFALMANQQRKYDIEIINKLKKYNEISDV